MTSLIDHTARLRLGVGAIDMLILDACDRLPRHFITTTEVIADKIGLPLKLVNERVAFLNALTPSPLKELDPTRVYYDAFLGEIEKPREDLEEKAIEIIKMFNELTKSHFTMPNNILLIKRILQKNNKITKDHFRSVITHKMQTWTKQNNMDVYITPATLFRSPMKFFKYYDEANNYWLNKKKNESYARATSTARY